MSPSLFFSFLLLLPLFGFSLPLEPRAVPATSFHVPIRRGRAQKRGDLSGIIGLGDNSDLLYTVPIELGGITTVVNLDTGSSDLWVISDACTTNVCTSSTAVRYPSSSVNSSGAQVTMRYGDSTTGSFASGPVVLDTVSIAGIAIDSQAFAAIDNTTNSAVNYGAAGIFGLGFPSESQIQGALVSQKFGAEAATSTDHFVASSYADGPLLSRISMTNALNTAMFTISLQRDTIDIGGTGQLTVGTLPDGVDNSSLTWVPVRLYSFAEGGVAPPTFAPNEVYPLRWEIDIDGVFLDGQKVADSSIPADGVDSTTVSALIDTGNSLMRGPSDVVDNILSTVSPTYNPSNANSLATFPCSTPHTMAFQIGGKLFPVDPRDFVSQNTPNDDTTCVANNLVSTDPPSVGALFRWSLGDPFMKSNLIAFYYGNLTHPSVDPPRIGFLSLVPDNADSLLTQAVDDADDNGDNFEFTSNIAPTASAEAQPEVTVIPQSASIQAAVLTSQTSETISTASEDSSQTIKPIDSTSIGGFVSPSSTSSPTTTKDRNSASGILLPRYSLSMWVYTVALLAVAL